MAGAGRDICKQVRSLEDVQKSPELKAILKRWDEKLKLIQTSIESKRARGQAAKNEMYLLISFYLVFQGGVMSMLTAMANAKRCEPALFPILFHALLSFVAFVGISCSVHDKFHDYDMAKNKRETDESESRTLQFNINMLLKKGETIFEDEDVASEETSDVEADMATSTESTGARSHWVGKLMRFFKERGSYIDVMVFLVVVFVIVLLNIIYVC